jgi:hypothetical protein
LFCVFFLGKRAFAKKWGETRLLAAATTMKKKKKLSAAERGKILFLFWCVPHLLRLEILVVRH